MHLLKQVFFLMQSYGVEKKPLAMVLALLMILGIAKFKTMSNHCVFHLLPQLTTLQHRLNPFGIDLYSIHIMGKQRQR
jgi:hypothetical protein